MLNSINVKPIKLKDIKLMKCNSFFFNYFLFCTRHSIILQEIRTVLKQGITTKKFKMMFRFSTP